MHLINPLGEFGKSLHLDVIFKFRNDLRCGLRADHMLDDVLYPVHVGLLLLFVFFDLLKHLLVLCFVDLQFLLEFLQLCPFLRGLFLKLYLFLELLVAVALGSSFEWSHYL